MRCLPIPNGVVCYAEVQDAEVTDRNGKRWRFDFDPRFGPLVVTKRGDPVAHQPGERSPFWPAFQAWFDAREGLPPRCSACNGSGLRDVAKIDKRNAIAQRCETCDGSGRQTGASLRKGEGR